MTYTKTMEALQYAHERTAVMVANLNASFTRQQAPAVAPAETPAATTNLIAQISFKLIADSSLASVRICMRYGTLDDAFFPKEVIVDRKKLDKLHLSSLDGIGPYILATVEIDSDKGIERAKKLLSGGITPLVELKATKYVKTRWIPTGVLDHSGSNVSIVMVPRPLANFWDRCGIKCEGNPMTIAKRQRRSFKDGDGFFARPVSASNKPVHFERGDGVMHAVPCTDVVYDVYKNVVGKVTHFLDEPIRIVVGYAHIDGDPADQMLLQLTDGSHGASPANLNKILNAHITEPQVDFTEVKVEGSKKAARYSKGDGIRFTLDTDFGQGKGHIFCRDLAHRTLLILDTKKEWKRIAGDIRFVISTDLHRPRQARLDAETVNNARLAQAGFVSEFGLNFTGGIAKNIGNVDALDKMFRAFLDDNDVVSTQDAIEGVPEDFKKTDWVLAAMAQLSSSKSWVNGELITMDGVDGNGNPEPMNIWRQPRLAKRAFRHLTERIMQINKLRIPVPIDAAVRAYALFDISIMDHSDPQYDGQGFYLSSGVLSAGTGVVFNTVLDEDGQPKVAERTMLSRDKDGFYSLVETGAFIAEMVDAEAATWRQPNGWCGEIWRNQLRLIKHNYYARMSRSPFMFLSVQPLHVIGELVAWLGHLMGTPKLNELLTLWGEYVPYVVVINAVLGGGDFDDLHFIAIQERLVTYLRSKEEIDFVKTFPRVEVNLTPAYSAKAVEYNRHDATLDANMVKADNSDTYGMRAYYRLLQLKASGGLISKVTNADLIWTSLLNDGKPLDVAFGGFCCNLEAVVDGEKKTGTDVAGASKASDAVFKAVTEISEHFAKRMPLALRKEPKYTTYKGAIDLELDILNKDFLLLKDAFSKRYQDPAKVQVMSYMEAFPATTEMIEVAKAWRASYNEVREAIMTKMNALLDSDSRFEGCSVIERERFAIGESVKEGDLQSFNAVSHLYETDKALLYGAAIAMYNKLLTGPLYIDEVTGLPTDRADALLFADKFNTVLREAMRYAKCVAQFPQAFEMEAQMGALAPELTIPGLSLVVVNGIEKKGVEEQERFITIAAQRARVLMHHLDENVDADMQELWAVCPALRNRSMDAVIVYQGGTHFGFIKKEQISLFKSTYGKDAVGTLARSVDSRTGAYNLYSAQVVINAA